MIPLLLVATTFAVECQRADTRPGAEPRHFVFFGFDHDRIAEPAFLKHDHIAGAQLMFTWKELEPQRDRYDFAPVRERLALLDKHGKRLWIQLQDVSFGERIHVPDYLRTDTAFHGGAARKYDGEGAQARFDGWAARRWDPAVRARFNRLLEMLGREFDGRIEGLNIAETAVSFDHPAHRAADFTHAAYAEGIREITSAARRAFTRSCVVVYANFMPGEWLPGDDKGYLRSVYDHAAKIGAGVGGPDLLPHRRGQQNHSQRLIASRPKGVIAAVAVQDGNLAEKNPATDTPVTVAELYRFATETLRVDYLFWGTEEPYYSRDVLPFLHRAAPERDTSATRMANQSFYLELGGSTGLASVSYDRKLNDWATVRLGYGRWMVPRGFLGFGDQENDPGEHAVLVPLTVNFVPRIRPGSMHRVELSAGIVSGQRWESGGDRRDFRAATAMIGYRILYRPAVFRMGMYYSTALSGDCPCNGFRPALSVGQQF